MGTSVPERPTEGLLPCPVCGRTVHKGEWFIIASQAVEDVCTGTPLSEHSGWHLRPTTPHPRQVPRPQREHLRHPSTKASGTDI